MAMPDKNQFPYMDTQGTIRSQERRRLYAHAEAFLMSQHQPMSRFDLRDLLAEFALMVNDDLMNRLVYTRTIEHDLKMLDLMKPTVIQVDDLKLNPNQPTKPDSI